eukprot:TRINITY_DN5981_c0_g1_i1.p1 TRINITY_DN5981_c0_g1~~TRINITY_DN5981_c0_g1_i1.p1  ORF type:complete len:104 (+),score=3.40 TRINITY_DN5981_c0_g1_i1:1156-1467(+)
MKVYLIPDSGSTPKKSQYLDKKNDKVNRQCIRLVCGEYSLHFKIIRVQTIGRWNYNASFEKWNFWPMTKRRKGRALLKGAYVNDSHMTVTNTRRHGGWPSLKT